jgi:hypothetical protein
MSPTGSFFWIGDPRHVSISSWREDIAWYCAAAPEALDLVEAYWGGADGDDNSVELITQDGEPVGTLDFMITQEELATIILAQADRTVEIRNTQLAAPPTPPSEKRPKPVKKRRRRDRDRSQGELLLPIVGGGGTSIVEIEASPTAAQRRAR